MSEQATYTEHIYQEYSCGSFVDPLHQREEIVRCRDCRYMHTVRHWIGMDVDECWLHVDRESGALGKERTEPNDFCSQAERKDENER